MISVATLVPTLNSILLMLVTHPQEQHKVFRELEDMIGSKENINWGTLRLLKYTDAFINEVLRIKPPIERIERVVTKPVTIRLDSAKLLQLERGTVCSLLLSAVHLNGNYFEDPFHFNPTRFLNVKTSSTNNAKSPDFLDSSIIDEIANGFNNIQAKQPYTLSFGLGSRCCIGEMPFPLTFLK